MFRVPYGKSSHCFPGGRLTQRSAEVARYVRMLECRRRSNEAKAAKTLQKLFRVFILKVRVHQLFVKATNIKRNRSATVIQKHCRRVLAMKIAAFRRVVYGVAQVRLNAAKSIQRMVRAKTLKVRLGYFATCNHIYRIRREASIIIQRIVLGTLVRRDLCFLKNSSKLVKWPHRANSVSLVGNFTRKAWKEEVHMIYSKYARIFWTDYLAKHFVSPGVYHIKFRVDGVLTYDNKLPVVQDEFGTFSNILDLGKRFPQIGSFDKLASIDQFQQMRKESDSGEGIVRSFSGNLDSPKYADVMSDDWMSDRELRLEISSAMAAHPKSQAQLISPEGSADALFTDIQAQVFGIADGVGEWERHGIDASLFSTELMKRSHLILANTHANANSETEVESLLHSTLKLAYEQTESIGSSTVLLAISKFSKLHTLILGDSCLLIMRRRKPDEHKLTRIFRSKEQQHFFNCPFQLVRLPRIEDYDRLRGQGYDKFIKFLEKENTANIGTKFDSPSDAQFFSITLRPGDIMVAGSDGLFDNLFDFEIKKYALELDEQKLPDSEFCTRLAHLLVEQAIERGFNSSYLSPFAKAAKRARRNYMGGKLDDVSVIVAKVV